MIQKFYYFKALPDNSMTPINIHCHLKYKSMAIYMYNTHLYSVQTQCFPGKTILQDLVRESSHFLVPEKSCKSFPGPCKAHKRIRSFLAGTCRTPEGSCKIIFAGLPSTLTSCASETFVTKDVYISTSI